MIKAFISGCAGQALSGEEISFYSEQQPWGLILFRRNCGDPEQLTALVASFREAVGRADAPVLIDQEGGRVQRLRPPHWASFPPQKRYGDLYKVDPQRGREAAYLGASLIGHQLRSMGITVNCLPLLDVLTDKTVDAIGDRAYGVEPEMVAVLGKETCEGLLAGGVLPVLKHLPGHGRATVDSHLELPCVEAELDELIGVDFAPFEALSSYPLAMTAHIRFPKLDPHNPATQSREIIENVIRGRFGFSGCLMTDDISMEALGGDMRERASHSFAAGCDIVLHCNGEMDQMRMVADAAPELSGISDRRCREALGRLPDAQEVDLEATQARFRQLMGD
ncbi:beta-N-acetylhexosaminidase [Roseibium sp. CAU 1637]|uniref:beta-N-acetylhexosaminidase n=1 Tax=Roseibium limicola TaxID=2816037 RepID=A0A939J9D5_9HYPH|nr:beta-N-acetylhexosaminidase [Roseibium limicola]MBO0346266.1 beta-N-acetylhexosaminidase [Roseibium limicola]